MKILFVSPEYPPNTIGGGGEVFKNLVSNYTAIGHTVSVLYGLHYPTHFLRSVQQSTTQGIRYYQVPEIPIPGNFSNLWLRMPPTIPAWFEIEQIIKIEKPDVAHLHGFGFIFIDIVAGILHKYHIPYILTVHGIPQKQNSSLLFRLLWKWYHITFQEHTLANAHKLTCVSKHVRDKLPKSIQKKSIIIPNGINLSEYKDFHRKNIRKFYNLSHNTRIILSLGRIEKDKGFQDVIEVLPRLKFPALYLIAGHDAGYKKTLISQAKQYGVSHQVQFVGFLNHEDKCTYLAGCDIVAIPSHHEGFGMVALEAMAFNKLILHSDIPSLQEILSGYTKRVSLKDVKNGYDLEQKISIKQDKNISKFNWTDISQQYLSVFKQL